MGSPQLRLLAVAFACVLTACARSTTSGASAPSQDQTAQVGRRAPDWSEKMLDGQDLTLASLRGKPVYLNFFATWCDGCKAESAALETVAREYRARGLSVVGVDILESPSK